jgi:hypothetical protein
LRRASFEIRCSIFWPSRRLTSVDNHVLTRADNMSPYCASRPYCATHYSSAVGGRGDIVEAARMEADRSSGMSPVVINYRPTYPSQAPLKSKLGFPPSRAETGARGQGTWFDKCPGRAASYYILDIANGFVLLGSLSCRELTSERRECPPSSPGEARFDLSRQ